RDTGLSHSTPACEDHVHHDGGACSHLHDHDHHHEAVKMKLPEELVEEEDMRLCGFEPCLHHDHDHESSSNLSGFGNCILVSLASLICLIFLPVILFFSLQFKGSLQNGLLMHWLDTQLQQIWPDHPILFDFWRRV
ncbi:unnamed protein product, partial [Brassica oleracea var. botrytis]